jgi:hypothetical protein
MELLRKAREELAQHYSQLVQVSHKYDKSVSKNAKLEDSIGATKRELEEFKRKDVENAKAIKQVFKYFQQKCCQINVLMAAGPIHGARIQAGAARVAREGFHSFLF